MKSARRTGERIARPGLELHPRRRRAVDRQFAPLKRLAALVYLIGLQRSSDTLPLQSLLPPLPQNPVATMLFGHVAVPPQFDCATQTAPALPSLTLPSGDHPPLMKPFESPDRPTQVIFAGLPPQSGLLPDPQIAITALFSGQVIRCP
jgi:hypothetical protein